MPTPTNQELLDAYRAALLAVSANQSYTISGRTLTRANLTEITKVIDWLERKIADADTTADATGTGIALARFV